MKRTMVEKNNSRLGQLATAAALAATLLLPTNSLVAQATLEEVIVTAQKKEESLQDTPIAITAFTANEIQSKGIDDISQIAAATPNLQFDTTGTVSGSSSAAIVYLRGVGSPSFQITDDPGVGTYVDGVYVSSSIGGVLDVIDVERIEILRGPQGTLFGRNTIGGAISVTTARPTDEEGGSLSVTVGNFNRLNFRGSMDITLADTLLMKVSGGSKRADGFIRHLVTPRSVDDDPNDDIIQTTDDRQRNRSGDDLGDDNETAVRVSLLYTPSDRLEVYLAADASRINETSAASSLVDVALIDGGVPGTQNLAFLYNLLVAPTAEIPGFDGPVLYDEQFIANDPSRETYATGPNGTDIDVGGISATLTYDVSDDLQIKSITAYRRTDALFNRDADGSPLLVTHGSNDYQHEQYSQEFQLVGSAFDGALDWIGGLYYFREEATDFFRAPIVQPIFGTGILNSEIENTSTAVFGQGSYRFNDDLRLTVGVRWTEDEKRLLPDYRTEEGTGGPLLVFDPVTGEQLPNVPFAWVEQTFDEITSRVSLEYNVSDSTLTYASYSQGYKGGGFNGRQPFFRAEGVIEFDPETLATVEVGGKWQSENNRYRVNAAAFYTEYDDIQITRFEGIAPGTQNGGNVEIQGFEFEGVGIVTDPMQIKLTFSYLDAEYVELFDPAPFPITNELANAPEMKASLGVDYAFPMSSGELTFGLDLSYTDDMFNDEQNSIQLFQPSHTIVDARLMYEPDSSEWMISLWGKNLSDERVITQGDANLAIGFIEANFNRPREVGMTFSRTF